MSYTGIIHRQDTDTGVTLRAKAVTPNKMKATVKDYKITVRKNPESAYQKALDLQSIAKNGLDSLIGDTEREDYSDIDFSQFIDDNTTVTVIDVDPIDRSGGTPLSDCINTKGVLVAFPKIGEPDAKGQLKFTTTTISDNGDTAIVSFVRDVIIRARDYHDLLNRYTAKFAWNKIYRNKSGNNDLMADTIDNSNPVLITENILVPGTADSVSGGYLAAFEGTDLIPSPDLEEYESGAALFPELGVGKVFIRTQIEDSLKTSTSTSLYAGERLEAGGTLNESPSFDTVYNYVTGGGINADTRNMIVDTYSTPGVQVRANYILKGLRIKSTLYMGKKKVEGGTVTYEPDLTKKVEVYIPLNTSSGYLTGIQVANKLYADENFVLEFRQTSYDGSAIGSFSTDGAFNNVAAKSLFLNDGDAYARFPHSQDAGVVGTENKIYTEFFNGAGIAVKFQINSIAAKVINASQLEPLGAQTATPLFGSTADVDNLFTVLDSSAIADSTPNSWLGCKFLENSGVDGTVIVFAISVTIAAYASADRAPIYAQGSANQSRYIKLSVYAGSEA